MKKLIIAILLFIIMPMTISNALTKSQKETKEIEQTRILEEITPTIYPDILTVIWNKREDLQLHFPDGENGIGTMEEWTLAKWAKEIGYKEYHSLLQYNEEAEKEYIYWKYKKLERKVSEVAERIYITDEYDCKHFAVDLQEELKEINISSQTITGFSDKDGHRWIAIEFEPISGEIIQENRYNLRFPEQTLTKNN